MVIKKVLALLLVVMLAVGCRKDNVAFTLKTIQLNHYHTHGLPVQNLHLEVFDNNTGTRLTSTDKYPNNQTLPATFIVLPSIQILPYAKDYRIELWGDATGHIASCHLDMDEYKIIFPIEMEVESDSLNVALTGNWK